MNKWHQKENKQQQEKQTNQQLPKNDQSFGLLSQHSFRPLVLLNLIPVSFGKCDD